MSILSKATLRIRKKRVVENAMGGKVRKGAPRAFVYYKTDPIFLPRFLNSYSHTNDSEILEIVRVLRRLGFVVDLIDREASWLEIQPLLKNSYALYFSNAAGNSAPLHAQISKNIDAQCKVYFAAGPEPELSNKLVQKRHAEFDERTKMTCIRRRILNDSNYNERLFGMDAIFYIGNEFSSASFSKVCDIPQHRIYPSTAPMLFTNLETIKTKDKTSFLYFGGNGLICKGLDLVLEAFDGLPSLSLDVCGPETENDFWEYYGPLMAKNPQIKFHGFVDVTGPLFHKLTSRAAYNIFPTCSEGCATSVVTTMRRGVIPVVSREAGIDLGDFGVLIKDTSISGIRELARTLSQAPQEIVTTKAIGTYIESDRYSMDAFRSSITSAFLHTLLKKTQFEFEGIQ